FLSRCGEYQPLVRSLTKLEGGNLEQIRNWAVMGGVNAAISCVLKNIKGKEDVSTSMVAGFGYGVALSLVTGMRGPRVMSVGVICALISGGLFKLDKLLLPEQAEDALHNKKKGGFSSLGIGFDHAMNFNKDLFTYNSLPLFSDRQVEDVNRGGKEMRTRVDGFTVPFTDQCHIMPMILVLRIFYVRFIG
ncbi:chloroplastic import inner membrane translocase subunit HP30-2-like protein, partial [Tanacetum coccineum]